VADSIVKVSNLGIAFADGTIALDDVHLVVPPGQFLAIVGPSGCGKSTLLRAVAGLQTPSSGEVKIDESNVSFVFQDPTLLPWLTTISNVELPLRIAGMNTTSSRPRAIEALEEVGLGNDLFKLPRQLSGGMRMRVSVARALVTQPDIFLLDEPFAAVDEIKREALNDMLLRIHEMHNFSAMFVTHSVSEAVYLADRVIVLSRGPGRIIADIPIPLARPRQADLRFDDEFTRICKVVSTALRSTADE
jgi:NitT/TauT family transport system ATP-binding protein